ncbi:hypothetical protein QQX98_004455 [Neonectria punicea]|uniref:Nephrocystin 3-like N-terminal domain-containing protein n=1 Tax=Neonectria punicea TaxID=979145 RepID=A0ABR1H9R7_9HYPO
MIAQYRVFEGLYLRGTQSEIDLQLEDALTRLYSEILTHLSYAVKFFSEKTGIRLLKSPFRMVSEERTKEILDRENEVNKFAKLADAETLRVLESAFTRLSNQAFRSLSEEKYNEILEWLSVASYYSHHQFIAQSRLPSAGQWVLTHKNYDEWHKSSSPSLLFLHGIAGSGKSTLCSVVVDSLLATAGNNASAAPFAYFYCANPEFEKARRSSDDVMRTILAQLAVDAGHRTKIKDFLCSEFERQVALAGAGKLDMPKLRTKDCVRLILELAEEDPVTIVIDGIDSVEDHDRPILIDALRKIISKADNVVKTFVTGRSSSHTAMALAPDFQIQITRHETGKDMQAFVDHLVDAAVARKLLLGGNLSAETRRMLTQALLDGAGEMEVLSSLISFPPDVYLCICREIARNIAVSVISWVLYKRAPLTPGALLPALTAGQDWTLGLSQMMTICANFVTLDTSCNVIRFAHQ